MLDTPNFIPDKTASLQSCRGRIPPPPGSFRVKTACPHKLSDFRDTFPKKVFYVIWSKSILKLAIWHIPGVSESHFGLSGAVFLKISPKGWNLEFLSFLPKNGWNGQKNHRKWYWELKIIGFWCQSWKFWGNSHF